MIGLGFAILVVVVCVTVRWTWAWNRTHVRDRQRHHGDRPPGTARQLARAYRLSRRDITPALERDRDDHNNWGN